MANRNANKLIRLQLTAAVIACLSSGVALAQDPQPADEDAQTTQTAPANSTTPVELDRVRVTGSLLRRTEYESTSPVQVITADTNIAVGQVSAAEFLQKSSVAAGSTQITNQFGGFVVEGGTGVQTLSLRGLGANRTLILLDGQRPGPAGTRGQVGAFDLSVLPTSILQRAEIVKDGSSSIYGSDAVAGVVNLITRKSVDRPEITFNARTPFEGGGEVFSVSGATGWNFDNGSIVLAGEMDTAKALTIGDRDFFSCPQDLVYDAPGGNRIDREDRSIIAGTKLGGCSSGNLYANTVIDAITGTRYIPSPDGVTVGLIPGYRPRGNSTYANSDQAFYEDVLNYDFVRGQDVINRQDRKSVYFATDFGFDSVNWKTQFLFNRRETEARSFRQFFPLVGNSPANGLVYANDPDYVAAVPSGLAQPIMPFRSDTDVKVDYFYAATKLDGLFNSTDTWAWEANATYSRSDGDYSNFGIVASRSGDVQFDDNAPRVDYFDPGFLSGERMGELADVIGQWHTGNTIYDQTTVNALATGELFDLPAGAVGLAFGLEHRRTSIDDQPSDLSRNGDLWGSTSAQVTKGRDRVTEAFAEFEVPLIRGVTGIESLTLNGSGRVFEYDTVEGSDNVWKLGLNWQINSAFRLRATNGTSYRAPGLYELYLGNQSGFASQLSIDPCILWGESNNDFIRANCAAIGIPEDFAGAASSAEVFSGGGLGQLTPENSRSSTVGLVFTPSFANVNVSFDYFDIEVFDQIGLLTTGTIISGCYGAPVFPNNFCDLFDRNPADHPTDPFKIEEVRNQYVNVNRQKTRGYDLNVNYDGDFAFGSLSLESQFTYTIEDIEQLFDSAEESGFTSENQVGYIGRPKLVGNVTALLERNDWTFAWQTDYVHGTKNKDLSEFFTYQGFPNAFRDIYAERRFYHTASVRYNQDDWSILVGIRNLQDKAPPNVSTGAATRYGNVPAFATQYDYFGRTGFVRLQYKF
ncbi:TonB-dependent receptor [Luteimonas sp. 9C]|uniref:TonB-dependent receptor plug domain-containing protein n=1 Tax=Luteimonas sp. 9C TaxID=2653148 RepID=UPI0012F271DD|nr:TonB-dependent receptor [Luteimonas sp. 9C]VXB79344.1 TonB-dependent receptor [Luteimonas sp. 9C]